MNEYAQEFSIGFNCPILNVFCYKLLKIMEILRAIKNNEPFSANLAVALFNYLELQILAVFFVNQPIPIYGKVLKFVSENSPLQTMVTMNFIINIIEILFLGIIFAQSLKKKDLSLENGKSNFLKILEIKPYLLFPQIISLNTLTLKNPSYFIIVASVFNIVFALLEVAALKDVNISLRFIQKNYIRKKDNSILHWILIVAAMVSGRFFSPLYATLIFLIRALLMIYNNFHSFESEEVRKSIWFNTMVLTQVIFLSLINSYLELNIFHNLTSVLFIFCLAFYSANCLAKCLSLIVVRYHLNKSTHILGSDQNGQILTNDENAQINKQEINKIVLELRIMIQIYLSKLDYNQIRKTRPESCENFDFWWNFWDRFMLQHKVNCNSVNCECQNFQRRSATNDSIERKIYLNKVYGLIKMLSSKFSGFSNKLKIIENHFHISIEKRPLKTYYQLMRLMSKPLTKQETLEVENLIIETRDNFKQLFLKQKVQNSELQVEPLFQFQIKIRLMRSQLSQMANQYKDFYEIFASNFVPMQTLKKNTRKLTEFKQRFTHQIDDCSQKYNRSIELLVFSMIYYTYFEEYTLKLDKIKLKAQCLVDYFKSPRNIMKKQIVEVFHPGSGAVKADLVSHVGRILNISKNLCHALGFSHRQVQGQLVNSLMPNMFAKVHEKIMSNFIEQGAMKNLKYKERVYYSRNINKFIVPLNVRMKVDYASCQSLCAVAFIKPTPTKSEFILMNNYGKIEEITGGLYKKCFEKAFGDEVGRVKRLCIPKMLLSVNYYLKDAVEDDHMIRDGILLTSDDEETLMDYYKFPELRITKRHDTEAVNSPAMGQSSSGFTSSTGGDLDFSQNINDFNVNLKESLKDYFKKLDTDKVIGTKISYKLQDYVTRPFRCKVLEITNIRDTLTGKELLKMICPEIVDISKHFRIDESEYSRFKEMSEVVNVQSAFDKLNSNNSKKVAAQAANDEIQSKECAKQAAQNNTQVKQKNIRGDSEASSVVSTNEIVKKKQSVITAFEKKTTVSSILEYGLTSLIISMVAMLVVICAFSMQLQRHYERLQNDNLAIMNFRIDFLLRLGINELEGFYKGLDTKPPSFLQEKKTIVETKMKNYLKKSISWIDQDISWSVYMDKMPLNYNDVKYTEKRSIYFFMRQFYANFAGDQTLTKYYTDNYVVLSNYLVGLGNKDEALIMNESVSYKSRISIILILYAVILVFVLVVSGILLRISFKMEEKITDFLPFFKASYARQKAKFYEQFIEYNKQSENIALQDMEPIAEQSQIKTFGHLKTEHLNEAIHETQTKFLRVVKDQKNKLSRKVLLAGLIIVVLCLFVVFFSEFFFGQAHEKFDIYLKLKNSAMIVQLAPSRIIMLYFININKLLRNQKPITFSDSYSALAQDRLFELQSNTGNMAYHGSQMQALITDHFKKHICQLIPCPDGDDQSTRLVKDQQVFYMAYRYINAFNYISRIIKNLPKEKDPKATVKKWIEESNVWEILQATQYLMDLIRQDEQQISDLFSDQISKIGLTLFSLSLTQIPILIMVMLFAKKKYLKYVSDKIHSTENIFKHISWNMLSENTYAVNYFEDKLKETKKF